MSDYTPTTEEVRADYFTERDGDRGFTTHPYRAAEFDRWLAGVVDEAEKRARTLGWYDGWNARAE